MLQSKSVSTSLLHRMVAEVSSVFYRTGQFCIENRSRDTYHIGYMVIDENSVKGYGFRRIFPGESLKIDNTPVSHDKRYAIHFFNHTMSNAEFENVDSISLNSKCPFMVYSDKMCFPNRSFSITLKDLHIAEQLKMGNWETFLNCFPDSHIHQGVFVQPLFNRYCSASLRITGQNRFYIHYWDRHQYLHRNLLSIVNLIFQTITNKLVDIQKRVGNLR